MQRWATESLCLLSRARHWLPSLISYRWKVPWLKLPTRCLAVHLLLAVPLLSLELGDMCCLGPYDDNIFLPNLISAQAPARATCSVSALPWLPETRVGSGKRVRWRAGGKRDFSDKGFRGLRQLFSPVLPAVLTPAFNWFLLGRCFRELSQPKMELGKEACYHRESINYWLLCTAC